MTPDEAREIVECALSGAYPEGEQAQYAFDAEYEEALAVLYPIDEDDDPGALVDG